MYRKATPTQTTRRRLIFKKEDKEDADDIKTDRVVDIFDHLVQRRIWKILVEYQLDKVMLKKVLKMDPTEPYLLVEEPVDVGLICDACPHLGELLINNIEMFNKNLT